MRVYPPLHRGASTRPTVRAACLVVACLVAVGSPSASRAQHGHGASERAATSGEVPIFRNVSVRHKIATRSPAAQRLFDQGLGLCFAFNHDEAIRSFEAAARADSTSPMPWWGIALALGPNINLPMSPEAEGRALEALAKANARLARASKSERAYVRALSARYAEPVGGNRAARDSAYADAMRALVRAYPADMNAAALCAEALMDLRPWDFWTAGGDPKPGTTEIVSRLEAALKRAPNHIGLLHLYIHALEASANPKRAEAAADRLRKISPEAGHLIHMPTHIYLRLGRYEEGAQENQRAIEVDRAYIDRWKVEGAYPMMYANHNIHMRWSALCSMGRSAEALAAGRLLQEHAPFDMARQMQPMELFTASPYLTLPRFGRWEETLAQSAPPVDLRLTNGAWRFARGLAYAATGKPAEAAVERDSLAAIAAAADGLYWGIAPGRSVLDFALTFLNGELAARSGRTDEAVALLERAAGMQDSIQYDEPPQWNMTARQALGAVLLAAGRAAEAETAYRKDLARHPENGWALRGLTDALRAGGKGTEADAAEVRFRRAWAAADVTLPASRF
jgi:tetratricopeptide (TPR) repeat protein